MSQNQLQILQEALNFSPDNVALRNHVAELLLQQESYPEAEEHFKIVLQSQPENEEAKFSLATCFYGLRKFSSAIIILEELMINQSKSVRIMLLYSKALLGEGAIHQAVQIYKELLIIDPNAKDEQLEMKLKQTSENEHYSEDDDELEKGQVDVEKPKISFKDVGGLAHVKNEIDLKIIKPMLHKDLYAAYGKKVGGGILLYGPPGCGKTHLARATAGEVNAKFISVGINDVLDMWIGSSEKNLHEIFETARKHQPCVLFFDEIDALGANRSDMKQSSGRHLINQFLAELDGLDADNDGLLILGATNAPWHLDPAFRRPGRFDRIIFVSPPDQESREAILKVKLEKKPVQNIDFKEIAKATPDFSGADLEAVIDLAIEEKLQEAFTSGVPSPLLTKNLKSAVKKHKASTLEWFNTAKNHALYANGSGLYDDILTYLKIKK